MYALIVLDTEGPSSCDNCTSLNLIDRAYHYQSQCIEGGFKGLWVHPDPRLTEDQRNLALQGLRLTVTLDATGAVSVNVGGEQPIATISAAHLDFIAILAHHLAGSSKYDRYVLRSLVVQHGRNILFEAQGQPRNGADIVCRRGVFTLQDEVILKSLNGYPPLVLADTNSVFDCLRMVWSGNNDYHDRLGRAIGDWIAKRRGGA